MARRQGVKRVPNEAESRCNPGESMSTSDDDEINLPGSKPSRKKVRWNRDVNADDSGVEISHDQSDSDSSGTESEKRSKVST